MNVDKFRRSLRTKWLEYYRDNRNWIVRLGIWVTCQGQRRPSSSFILATLSILEPKLTQLLPLVVDLSQNPDRIVIALGLNFNPDEAIDHPLVEAPPKQLPASEQTEVRLQTIATSPELTSAELIAKKDEDCSGTGSFFLTRD